MNLCTGLSNCCDYCWARNGVELAKSQGLIGVNIEAFAEWEYDKLKAIVLDMWPTAIVTGSWMTFRERVS